MINAIDVLMDNKEKENKYKKFEILEQEKIDKNVYYYLENLLSKVNIEILGQYEGKLFDLMKRGKLEGWCWQTTETAALFMPDDVVIYRANLKFAKYDTYYHSFIQFMYEEKDYIFDPCLCMINTADLYLKTFNTEIKGYTSAKEIKEYFLNYISAYPKKENNIITQSDRFMRKFFENYIEDKQEITVHDKENPYAPMYRNNSGYKDINIENNKIKSLTVHYYMNA